jgi:Domain of unknown function (DUF5078)
MRLLVRPRQILARAAWRAAIALLVETIFVSAFPDTAAADSTDGYPIPHRMIVTTCTAEQILPAARDFAPIYYERYMIDKNNRPADVQQGAIDRIHCSSR